MCQCRIEWMVKVMYGLLCLDCVDLFVCYWFCTYLIKYRVFHHAADLCLGITYLETVMEKSKRLTESLGWVSIIIEQQLINKGTTFSILA